MRLIRTPLAIISTDSANCYDRMVHKYVSLACRKWGISSTVMQALLQPLHKARHHTRTAFEDSSTYFEGDQFQGTGQCNTGAAPHWTSISTPMIEIIKKMNLCATFTTPISLKGLTLALIAFVDDAELFIKDDNNSPAAITDKAALVINVWRDS